MNSDNVNSAINNVIKKTVKILIYAVAVFMIVYLIYLAFDANYSSVKTEVATMKTVEKSINTKVFIVRDENYILGNASGTIVPLVKDGQRVAEGEQIAAVFSNDEDAGNYVELNRIKSELARFEDIAAAEKLNIRDINTYDQTTNEEFLALVDSISDGKYNEISDYVYSVRDRVTSRQISLGEKVDTSAIISQLNAEISKLSVSQPTYLLADNTGYYINATDGYEGVIDYKNVKELTTSQISKAFESKADESKINNMGKLVNNFNWYVVANVDRNDIDEVTVGKTVTVRFLDSSAEDAKMVVEAINTDGKGQAAIVLKCNTISAGASQLRIENAEIIINRISGYRVPKEALRTLDGVNGVYIKRGNLVNFRRITTVYTGEDYVIARTYEDENANYEAEINNINEENRIFKSTIAKRHMEEPDWIINREQIYSRSDLLEKSYIKLYDEVIVEGNGLYDSKIV